jgi:hypothetical protein
VRRGGRERERERKGEQRRWKVRGKRVKGGEEVGQRVVGTEASRPVSVEEQRMFFQDKVEYERQ